MLRLNKKRILIALCFAVLIGFHHPLGVAAKEKTVDEWFKSEQTETKDEQNKTTNSLTKADDESSHNISFPLLRMFIALAFIIFLIYALAKFINKRTRAFHGIRSLESLGGISVGQNRSIQLIKVGNRLLVVGVSDSINLLKEITDEEEIQQFIEEQQASLQQEDIFTKSKQWLANKTKGTAKSENFTSILDKQLKKIVEERKKIYSKVEKKESKDE